MSNKSQVRALVWIPVVFTILAAIVYLFLDFIGAKDLAMNLSFATFYVLPALLMTFYYAAFAAKEIPWLETLASLVIFLMGMYFLTELIESVSGIAFGNFDRLSETR